MTQREHDIETSAELAYVAYQTLVGTKVGFYDMSALERKAWLAAAQAVIAETQTTIHSWLWESLGQSQPKP
jgi:hypothetical protein